MYLEPKVFETPETFRCKAMSKKLSLFTCMSSYVDANALNKTDSPCFKCDQGVENRAGYSRSL